MTFDNLVNSQSSEHREAEAAMFNKSHIWTLTAVLCALTGASILGASAAPARVRAKPTARLARTISLKETARLLPVGSVGSKIKERGSASGSLNGVVTSNLTIAGSHISGTFVLATNGGTINARTTATVVGQVAVPVVRFAGSISVSGGNGRYAHASGHLSVKGTIRRRNYELTEEASGSIRY
jgi:hypothetical protein